MERFAMNVDFTFDKLFGEGSGRQFSIMGFQEVKDLLKLQEEK